MRSFLVAAWLASLAGAEPALNLRGQALPRDPDLPADWDDSAPGADSGACQTRAFDSSLGADGGQNMLQCQGDCDNDGQCAPGLKCKQRDANEPVPGCSGGSSWPQMDYCYDPRCEGGDPSGPPGLPPLDSSAGPDGAANMPKCSGDCDEDGDCAQGLRCYQRSGRTPVPGCSGGGVPNFDYCYDPADDSTPPPPPTDGPACLCVFDVDRTLTGKQGTAGECPGNVDKYPIWDSAYYPGGYLTISDAGNNLQNTFCGKCYMGIVSAGSASGKHSDERKYLLSNVLVGEPFQALLAGKPQTGHWSEHGTVHSPLVLAWPDRKKQFAVGAIVDWYGRQKIDILPENVYFFGDRSENIPPFQGTGYNAREISCSSRDVSRGGMVGWCGATTGEIVNEKGVKGCSDIAPTTPAPTPEPTPEPTPLPPPPSSQCLCIFDVDRTLTGRQDDLTACPDNLVVEPKIWDTAYGTGHLTLSEGAQKLQQTFCNACFLGIVSAGDASGASSPERPYLLDNVLTSPPFSELRANNGQASAWSDYPNVDSPLVLGWPNREKQYAAEGIVKWYERQGITIPANKVHFFGDRTENIQPFADKGFNSREISCGSRDYNIYASGMVGLCGARVSEIVDTPGVANC